MTAPDQTSTAATTPRGRSGLAFPIILVVAAVAYFAFVGFRLTMPVSRGLEGESPGFLARCREICERYGLLPTGNLAKDAEAYLEIAQANKLSDGLEKILADEAFEPIATQAHPLTGEPAPDFALLDSARKEQGLAELRNGRPTVVVFYYGYWCNHCVAQLFGLEKDLHYFRELGAEVIAISADSPEHTTEKFKEYGQFHFPVLSDPENKIAEAYQVFRPATQAEPELLDHGTFVLNAEGKILWSNFGPEPFLDNKTLLFVLAKSLEKTTSKQD